MTHEVNRAPRVQPAWWSRRTGSIESRAASEERRGAEQVHMIPA